MANTSGLVRLVGGTETLAAAGSVQSTATELVGGVNVISTVTASTADGVVLPDEFPLNVPLYVLNVTSVALDVFPPSGGAINGGSANAAKALAANMSGMYIQYSTGNWGAVLSA